MTNLVLQRTLKFASDLMTLPRFDLLPYWFKFPRGQTNFKPGTLKYFNQMQPGFNFRHYGGFIVNSNLRC